MISFPPSALTLPQVSVTPLVPSPPASPLLSPHFQPFLSSIIMIHCHLPFVSYLISYIPCTPVYCHCPTPPSFMLLHPLQHLPHHPPIPFFFTRFRTLLFPFVIIPSPHLLPSSPTLVIPSYIIRCHPFHPLVMGPIVCPSPPNPYHRPHPPFPLLVTPPLPLPA